MSIPIDLAFSTEGMTSVSAAHHHLDFYGMLIALLYLRLARLDGDRLWEAQARKMMDACLSLIGCAFMIAYLSATRFRFARWVKLALAVYEVCLSAMTLTYERHWRNTDMLKQNIREILKSRKDYDDGKKTLITAPVNAGH